jgi:3-oxoacyl-[acyl-carrier protein] reductase
MAGVSFLRGADPVASGSMPGLKDRVALVTGSARGIGRAIALGFAAEGCSVIVNYRRSRDEAEEVARRISAGGKAGCLVFRADVSKEDEVTAMVQAAVARFGRLDILVNNAGIAGGRSFLDISPAEWHDMIENDLTSVFLCSQAVLPHMLARGWGRIINIASTSGMTGGTSGGHYAAAKGGVIALTKSLGKEFASRGVTVNAIVPSKIETEMLERSLESEERKRALREKIPVGRFGRPEEIAGLALFLASETAAYITAETIVASGGY